MNGLRWIIEILFGAVYSRLLENDLDELFGGTHTIDIYLKDRKLVKC